MNARQGDVLWASDPFRDDGVGRPWLVVGNEGTPFHGEQFVCLAITSKGYHDEAIRLDDETLPLESYVMPWSVATVGAEDVFRQVGSVSDPVVSDAVSQLTGYLDE